MTTSTKSKDIPSPRRWAQVPPGIYRLGLSYEAASAGVVLLSFCRPPDKLICWPSLAVISKALSHSESRRCKPARRITDELVASGLVTVVEVRDTRGHRVRRYDLTVLWAKAVAATNEIPDEADLAESSVVPPVVAAPVHVAPVTDIRQRFGGAKLSDAEPLPVVTNEPEPEPSSLEARRAALEAEEAKVLAELEAIRARRAAR